MWCASPGPSWPSSAQLLDADVEVRVWDSSAEIRYLVLPLAPDDVDAHTEAELAGLVTRDHMIGVVR